jgi:hypothetical protein
MVREPGSGWFDPLVREERGYFKEAWVDDVPDLVTRNTQVDQCSELTSGST